MARSRRPKRRKASIAANALGTPTQVLLEWIDRLPPSLLEEIAGYLVGGLPHLGASTPPNAARPPIDSIRDYLARSAGEPFEDAMASASLAGVVDVLFATRAKPSDWERTREVQERLASKADTEGQPEFAGFIRSQLTALSSRAEQWVAAGKEWRRLRTSSLSAAAIDRFLIGAYDDSQMHELLGTPRSH